MTEQTITAHWAQVLRGLFERHPDRALTFLRAGGRYLPDEPTTLDPGEPQRTWTRIAAVQGGRGLYYVEQLGAQHWLVIA